MEIFSCVRLLLSSTFSIKTSYKLCFKPHMTEFCAKERYKLLWKPRTQEFGLVKERQLHFYGEVK